MLGRLPGKSFVFMEFEQDGGVSQFAALALAAFELDFAELLERFLELAGEARAVEPEGGEQTVGVDDVERRGLGAGGWGLGTREEIGFEVRYAFLTPTGVG